MVVHICHGRFRALCTVALALVAICSGGKLDSSASMPEKVMSEAFLSIIKEQLNVTLSAPCLIKLTSPEFKPLMMGYLDAVGKPGPGLFLGNIFWPGSYDECKSIPDSHYCVTQAQLSITNATLATMGLCAPTSCNEDDIIFLFNSAMKYLKISQIYIPKDKGYFKQYGKNMVCYKKAPYSAGTIGSLVLCGFLLFMCLIGTVTEIVKDMLSTPNFPANKSTDFMPVKIPENEDNSSSEDEDFEAKEAQPLVKIRNKKRAVGDRLIEFLLCFSLIKNTRTAMNTDVPDGAVTSLNGIRVLSMWWVLLGHAQSFAANPTFIDNIVPAMKVTQRFTFLPLNNGYFAVDSFFVLSGLLVAYLSMRRFDKYGSLPLVQFYVHRFLRLTPMYLFVILFFIYIYPHMGYGPMWSTVMTRGAAQPCKDYWWTNILYINNFYPVDPSKTCIGWTWYLANDMQFYVISPIFLYAMYKFRIPGALISMTPVLIISFVVTGVLYAYYNFVPFPSLAYSHPELGAQDKNWMGYTYVKPYCRIAPYLAGMFAGYLLHKKIKLQGKLKWLYALIGWVLAVAFGLMLTYGTWPYFKENGELPNKGVNISYGTFSRFIWGVALAWVVYACHFGFGGLIDKVLSWRAFIPLSRLTYGVYMIHILVLFIFYTTREVPMHYTDIEMAVYFMASAVASYACAFILSVCVELPAANLEKLVFKF